MSQTNVSQVSPACAGMIPGGNYVILQTHGEPRMRGDDPHLIARIIQGIL